MKLNANTFKKLLDFKGRASKKEFLNFWALGALFSITVYFADYFLETPIIIGKYRIFYCLFLLLYLPPFFAYLVRRLHDIGRSGWWAVGILIPLIGWIGLLFVIFAEGKPGANQYGSNPKEQSTARVIDK
jgi:uncharacterized membrane protein YhaH (DUF805 family)